MKGKMAAKRLAARIAGRMCSGLHYANTILLISHMRSLSTALSNAICAHPDVNGYGETHVPYDSEHSPALLAINHWRRNARKRGAARQFDKLLHNELDCSAPPGFFEARAVFLLREPAPAIQSICQMYAQLGRARYREPDSAAAYYISRLEQMEALYLRFAPSQRMALTHAALTRDPDQALLQLSQHLGLEPALTNAFVAHPLSKKPGGGDPINSAKFGRIEGLPVKPVPSLSELGIAPALVQRVGETHVHLLAILAAEPANLV